MNEKEIRKECVLVEALKETAPRYSTKSGYCWCHGRKMSDEKGWKHQDYCKHRRTILQKHESCGR